MKKICFVTTVSMTLKAFVLDTAKYLYQNGDYDITFICDNDEQFKNGLPEYIKYIPVSMKRGVNLSGIRAIFAIYKVFRSEKFDIVQYSTPNASLYASVASRLAGIPVRLYCQWGIAYVGFSGFKRILFKLIEKVSCSLSTWIEPDSYGNLNFGHEEGLYKKDKSSVVWNGSASGVDLSRFDIKNKSIWKQEIREKLDIREGDFVIGFVGRVTRDKGINELLHAVKKIIDDGEKITLLIIGTKDKLSSIDEVLYMWSIKEKSIIYYGFTNEVEKFFAAMDIFVLPSYREGFGSVVIEAEAMGVPVIVSNIPGPTEAMIEGETGLIIKKRDADSLEDALKFMIGNKHLLETMGSKGRNFVERNFDKKVLLQKILEDRENINIMSR